MIIGLIADIHANAHALEAVLKSAREKNVEKLLCCGDYVGYYYEPERIMALLDEWDWSGVSGNHEVMLMNWLNRKNRNKIKAKYGSGISIAANNLQPVIINKLCEMPNVAKLNIDNYKVLLCHGSPWDLEFYLYPDAKQQTVDKMFRHDPDFNILVYGHTHYPVIWEQDKKVIINPGSVGQPRDHNISASWAIWDTTKNDVQFFREQYDANPVIEMCKKYDPKVKYLIDVLMRE